MQSQKVLRIVVVFLAFLVTALSLLSIFSRSFFPIHDFTHVARLVEMDTAVRDGHIPVRWSKHLGYGSGMPLFTFYGPLPFYIAEVFHLVGFSELVSIKILLFLIGIGGFFGTYLLTRRWFGNTGGLVSATAFVFIPYRALDIYVRGAFNEVFAISIIPWVLYLVEVLRDQKTKERIVLATSALAISLAALLTSHNLMTMMFLPFIYGYILVRMAGAKKKVIYLVASHLALAVSVALAAFYLFPSFLEKNFTQVDKLISGYGMYQYHFLYIRQLFFGMWDYGGSVLGIEDDMSFHLGWPHLILAALGVLALLRRRKIEQKIVFGFLGLSLAAGLFLTTFKSVFVWDSIPLMAYIQFPWRFLSLAAVILPLFAGASVLLIRRKNKRILFAGLCILLLVGVNLRYHRPKELLDDPDGVYYTDPARIAEGMSGILPDYIPKTVKTLPKASLERVAGQDGWLPQNFKIVVSRTQEMLVTFQSGDPVPLVFKIFAFPGWAVYDNGKRVEYTLDNDYGWMKVTIPAGEHAVAVRFEETPVRAWSDLASVFGVMVLIGMVLYGQRNRHSTH